MLPLFMLTAPPIVMGGSYCMWYSGQQIALKQKILREAPPSGAAAYASGVATGAGTYYVLQTAFFPQNGSMKESQQSMNPKSGTLESTKQQHTSATRGNGSSSSSHSKFVPPHKQAKSFQPPQTMGEAFQRIGRPMLMRVGAGGFALLCAGLVQTYVAVASSQ
jgi:hypothetical protein